MSKKAVIEVGGIQHIVAKGDIIEVDRQPDDKLEFQALMIVEGEKSVVGTPYVEKSKVTARKVEDSKGDKVTSIRFKAKKRVDVKRGHRQPLSKIEITAIS